MELERIHRLERFLLFLMIIALPINCLPKKFSIPTFGQNLTGYFFLIALMLLIYEFIKYRYYIPKRAIQFIFIYLIWQCVCLVIGLYTYQYDNLLTIDQIPKLEWMLLKFKEYGIILPEMLSIKWWLFGRTVKGIVGLENVIFVSMFYVYHLYRFNFRKAFEDFRKAITILVIIMGIYSFVELSWLKLNVKWAEELMRTINPLLYDVETTNTWWPPLLWKGQLRSLTREPSFFGILSIMILPFLWSYLFEKKNNMWSCLLLFYYCLMIFATNARTAIVVTLVQLLLLIVGVLLSKNMQYVKRVVLIIIITALAFGVNLINFKGFIQNQENISSIELLDSEDYVDRNINSIANTTSRSNGARWSNLLANIYVVQDHPVFGVGNGLKDAYMYDYILDIGKNNKEVENWSRDMLEKGVLKSGYPALNKYADVAVTNGIPGLLLYLLPVLIVLIYVFKYRNKINDIYVIVSIISMMGLLAAQLSSAGFAECNGFIWGLMSCYIASQKYGDVVHNEDKIR